MSSSPDYSSSPSDEEKPSPRTKIFSFEKTLALINEKLKGSTRIAENDTIDENGRKQLLRHLSDMKDEIRSLEEQFLQFKTKLRSTKKKNDSKGRVSRSTNTDENRTNYSSASTSYENPNETPTNADPRAERSIKLVRLSNYAHRYLVPVENPTYSRPLISYSFRNENLSFEQAVAPFKHSVVGIERIRSVVERKFKQNMDFLSRDESAALHLFSMEIEPTENSFYHIFNETLMRENAENIIKWNDYYQLLLQAIEQLPQRPNETVYRFSLEDLGAKYTIGLIFNWPEFALCSKSDEMFEYFKSKNIMKTLFKIQCFTGRDIGPHCYFRDDREFVLCPVAQFRVVNSNRTNNTVIIELEEQKRFSQQFFMDRLNETIPDGKVNLAAMTIDDRDIGMILEHENIRNRCRTLDLASNQIHEPGANIMANMLHRLANLNCLYLSGNFIADVGVQYLARTINDLKIKVLGLSANQITSAGARSLAEMLTENKKLHVLGLEDNGIDVDGLRLLLIALERNRVLRRLLLAGNPKINDSGVDPIVKMSNSNNTLQRLDLRRCSFSDPAKRRLERLLPRSHLEILFD